MSLRDGRLTTYSSGSTPAVKAFDLNAMQDEIADLWAAKLKRDYWFYDDFDGSVVSTAKWTSITNSGGGSAPSTGNDNDTNDASGILLLDASGSNGSAGVNTNNIYAGLEDFSVCFLAKGTLMGGGTSSSKLQYHQGLFEARSDTNPGKWGVRLNGTLHNTSVARSTTLYQLLEFRRTEGVFEFYIDEELVWSEPLVLNMYGSLALSIDRQTSGQTQLRVDKVGMWSRR